MINLPGYTVVYRLKSDNYNCYVTSDAYKEIKLQMSTGDFHSHKTKRLTLDGDLMNDLMWHREIPLVDIVTVVHDDGQEEDMFSIYDGCGDCNYEPLS